MREDFGSETMALGDLDGDGDLDLVSCRFEPRKELYFYYSTGKYYFTYDPATRLLANDGTGKFAAGVLSATAPYGSTHLFSYDYQQAHAVALGDLDGDGDLDIVEGRRFFSYWYDVEDQVVRIDPVLRVLVNNGNGSFGQDDSKVIPASLGKAGGAAMILGVESLELGDLDGDGSLDIVLACRYPGLQDEEGTGYGQFGLVPTGLRTATRVLLNDGSGRFADATADWLPAPVNGAYLNADRVILRDLDGDGDPDLVLSSAFPPGVEGITEGTNRPLRVFGNE